MTSATHETAPTEFVQTDGIRFAYRRFGRRGDTPLLLLNYFAANMDHWDPLVTNGLAAEHDVILMDYPGIGDSSGETPATIAGLTRACVTFCKALEITRVDVLGYSLGGMIAQQLGFEHPDLVQRIVLLGTGPQGGEGMVFTDLSVEELDDVEGLVLKALFSPSDASQAAGRAYLERLKLRVDNRDAPIAKASAVAELSAIREWGIVPRTDRYAMLQSIHQPTLVVHGNKDVVVMPINALLLAQHLPNAQLIIYPDSSHAAHSQHAEIFLKHFRLFFQVARL
jgi:pimeloyl-ACP methyl ester carboxylesterase